MLQLMHTFQIQKHGLIVKNSCTVDVYIPETWANSYEYVFTKITFQKCLFIIYLQHRDTPENNPDTPFEFTKENLKVSRTLSLFICKLEDNIMKILVNNLKNLQVLSL